MQTPRFSGKLKTRPNTQGDHQIQTPRFSGKLKTNLSILLAVSAALAACGDGGGSASLPKAAQINAVLATGSQTVTASMRTLWQTYISGGTIDLNDSDIQAKVIAIGNTAQNDRSSLIPAASRTTCLWDDLCTWTASANLTSNYKRVQEMVLGYSTQGSSLYHDAT